MLAAAFIKSISFLLFACSARLLLPVASLSLTRRTVCIGHARSFAASTSRRQRYSRHGVTHFHAAHRRVHNVVSHGAFHRPHWLVSWPVANRLFEKTVKLRNSHIMPRFHLLNCVVEFLFQSKFKVVNKRYSWYQYGIPTALFRLYAVFSARFSDWSVSSQALASQWFASIIPTTRLLLTSSVSPPGISSLLTLPYAGTPLLANARRNISLP